MPTNCHNDKWSPVLEFLKKEGESLTISDSHYLSEEERNRIDELKEKVKYAKDDDDVKRYTTQITLIYEKARVREETSRA